MRGKKQGKTRQPQNRQKTGSKKLRSGCDPDVGKSTRFPPGISGNPGGRPRKYISEAYEFLAQQKVPGDPKGRTYAELLAEAQFRQAITGKTQAAREITDRIQGKATQPVEISKGESGPLELNLTVQFTDEEQSK